MLKQYLETALRKARYEIRDDEPGFYGEIPECRGVWATAATLEECRLQLEDVLEEWVLFRVSRNLSLPVLDGVELRIREVA